MSDPIYGGVRGHCQKNKHRFHIFRSMTLVVIRVKTILAPTRPQCHPSWLERLLATSQTYQSIMATPRRLVYQRPQAKGPAWLQLQRPRHASLARRPSQTSNNAGFASGKLQHSHRIMPNCPIYNRLHLIHRQRLQPTSYNSWLLTRPST